MRSIVAWVARKRNPAFVWSSNISNGIVFEFVVQQTANLLRGLHVVLRLRHPRMMLRGKRVTITGLSQFSWGGFLRLGEYVHINAVSRNGICLGNNVSLGAYSRLVASGSILHPGVGIKLGNNVGIGEFAYLGGGGGLEIGADTIVGQYFSCHPENHNTADPTQPVRLQGVTRKGIRIGSNCWIGSKVTVLDGVTIGNNSVIAAGAVVNKSFPANSVIGGVPARDLKVAAVKNQTVNYELVAI